jgi:hypothetical protein
MCITFFIILFLSSNLPCFALFLHSADEKWALESLVSPNDPSRTDSGSSSFGFENVTSSLTLPDGSSVNVDLDEEARYIEESMKRDIAASLGKGNNAIQNQVGHCIVLHCTALFRTVLHYIALHYIAPHQTVYCTILYCTAPYCIALHNTVLHYTILYCTTQYCTALHHTVLHYTKLYCTILHCTIESGTQQYTVKYADVW